jgi:hypothetical protein
MNLRVTRRHHYAFAVLFIFIFLFFIRAKFSGNLSCRTRRPGKVDFGS